MWGATNQPNPTCRQHSDNRKSLKKTCDANNFGTAAKILILKKVLRNNPTFRNFLWKNIGGLLWWPPTPLPLGAKNFEIEIEFSPNIGSNKKNSFNLILILKKVLRNPTFRNFWWKILLSECCWRIIGGCSCFIGNLRVLQIKKWH